MVYALIAAAVVIGYVALWCWNESVTEREHRRRGAEIDAEYLANGGDPEWLHAQNCSDGCGGAPCVSDEIALRERRRRSER